MPVQYKDIYGLQAARGEWTWRDNQREELLRFGIHNKEEFLADVERRLAQRHEEQAAAARAFKEQWGGKTLLEILES